MGSKATEFEIKALAPSKSELDLLLKDFEPSQRGTQVDVYYDVDTRALFMRGVFVRIRDELYLDVKYNSDDDDNRHLICEETRYQLPTRPTEIRELASFLAQFGLSSSGHPTTLDELFKQTGLARWVTLAKHRTTFTQPGVELCVDEVEDLGRFVEIEVSESELAERYVGWAAEKGLRHLPVGYVELYLRQHDYDTYARGRYTLPEDAC